MAQRLPMWAESAPSSLPVSPKHPKPYTEPKATSSLWPEGEQNEPQNRAAWGWLGPAPDAALDWAAYEQWDFATGLREYLAQNRFELLRAGKSFVILTAPPCDHSKLKKLDAAIDGAELCKGILLEHADAFPVLEPDRGWDHLHRVRRHHDRDGFRVRPNMGGLDFPDQWPLSICENLQTIYSVALRLQEAKP